MSQLPDDPYLSPAARPSKRTADLGYWDYVWKAFVVVVGIIIGGIVALIIAISTGWLSFELC